MKRIPPSLIWVAAGLPSVCACLAPVESCLLQCGTTQACPIGLECNDEGLCVLESEPEGFLCHPMEQFPAGGSGPTSPPAEGGGGSDSSGGSAPGAPLSNPGPGGNDTLRLESPSLVTACAGKPQEVALRVLGGTPPFRWIVDEAEQASIPPLTRSPSATLVINPLATTASEGELTITVADASGQSQSSVVRFEVAAVPSITTEALPGSCPNGVYDFQLTAHGGSGNYTWTIEASEDLPWTADPSGRLKGVLPALPPAGTTLRVSVDDGVCGSDEKALVLPAEPVGNGLCPQISAGGLGPGGDGRLPPPCAGVPYSVTLAAVGGTSPFEWSPVGLPEGLALSPDGRLTGSARQAGEVVARVTDGRGLTVQQSFALEPRASCWLGYLSREGDSGSSTSGQRLHLVDPLLASSQSTAHQALPRQLEAGSSVLDFAFASSGRLLAYRISTEGAQTALRIADVDTWQELTVELAAPVLDYQWAPADDVLAVAIGGEEPEVPLIDALRVHGATPSSPLSLTSLGPVELDAGLQLPSDPTSVSHVTWIAGGAAVAFFTVVPQPLLPIPVPAHHWGRISVLDDALSPATHHSFAYPVLPSGMRPTPSGALVSFSTDWYFHGLLSTQQVVHSRPSPVAVAPAPTGTFLAHAEGGQLHVYSADLPFEARADELPSCDEVLAISSEADRIACILETPNGPGMAIHERTEDAVSPLGPIQGADTGLDSALSELDRSFSSNGSLFVFISDGQAHVVGMDQGTPRTTHAFREPIALGTQTRVSFSPDSSTLAVHEGNRVYLHSLFEANTPNGILLTSSARASTACGASTLDGDWCGLDSTKPLSWSVDSRAVALPSNEQTILLYDVSLLESGYVADVMELGAGCTDGCTEPSSIQFQP